MPDSFQNGLLREASDWSLVHVGIVQEGGEQLLPQVYHGWKKETWPFTWGGRLFLPWNPVSQTVHVSLKVRELLPHWNMGQKSPNYASWQTQKGAAMGYSQWPSQFTWVLSPCPGQNCTRFARCRVILWCSTAMTGCQESRETLHWVEVVSGCSERKVAILSRKRGERGCQSCCLFHSGGVKEQA